MTLFMQFVGFISLTIGVLIGYRFAFVIYQYIKIKLPNNERLHYKKLDTVIAVDRVVSEKYKLGVLNLYPHISPIWNNYSAKDLNSIYDFLERMDELGIQYIYLKPANKEYLIHKAIRLNTESSREGMVYLREHH